MKIDFINPGDLDQRIRIVRVTSTIGAKGQDIASRTLLAERWASVEADAGEEGEEESNVRSVIWLTVVMYRFAPLMLTDEIEYDGRRFNVTSINEIRMTPFVTVKAREVMR